MPAVASSDAAAFFCSIKKFRMATHILERREQLRPVLKAAVDAEALKRGASLEEVGRLHDELATLAGRSSGAASACAAGLADSGHDDTE